MRRFSPAAISLALVLVSLTPLPAQASHESLDCAATLDVAIEPGLSLMPSKGTVTASEEPGSITCNGMLQGREVTGPGALGITGTYGQSSDAGDTCSLVTVTGTYSLTLPTRQGPVKEKGNFAEVLGPTKEGSFSAVSDNRERNWAGTFEFSPTQGDCLLTPITAARVTLQLEGGHGGGQPATVGVEGPGGAVVDREPLPEVAERQPLHEVKAVGVEGDPGAVTVGEEEGVVAPRGEQFQGVGGVVERRWLPDQTAGEGRLKDLRLALIVVTAISPPMAPLWPILAESMRLPAW